MTGSCYAYFAYDIGLSVDLDRASTHVGEATRRQQLPLQRRRGASWLAYEPPPLRFSLRPGPVAFGPHETDSVVECSVFDFKLVGDQHLARVYNLAAARVHLAEWDAAILRKLDTAESIYQKLSQFETGRRMEILEIAIVVLIALSIVLTFVPGGGH